MRERRFITHGRVCSAGQKNISVLNTYHPPGQTTWSKALVRQGADPGKALAAVLGVSAEDIQ